MKGRAVMAGVCSLAVLGLWPVRAYAVPIPWRNCGQAGDIISVQRASVSTWPLVRGQPVTAQINAIVSKPISAVSGTVSLTYAPAGLSSSFHPISMTWHNRPVNIAAGPYSMLRTYTIPLWIRPGVYQIHFDAHLPTGQGVLCVDLVVPVK